MSRESLGDIVEAMTLVIEAEELQSRVVSEWTAIISSGIEQSPILPEQSGQNMTRVPLKMDSRRTVSLTSHLILHSLSHSHIICPQNSVHASDDEFRGVGRDGNGGDGVAGFLEGL